jgi:hypothetical protein
MSRWTLPFLVLVAGCTVSDLLHGGAWDKTSQWLETGEVRKSRDEIARTVRELLLRQGYTAPDFDGDRLETPWDVHPSPRFREGYRTKVEVEVVPLGPGAFNVRVRSTMEINNTQGDATLIQREDWIGAGASEKHKTHIADEALKINSTLKLRFFGLNP